MLAFGFTALSLVNKILPGFSPSIIKLFVAAYLLESYFCSTRRYLCNIMTPQEVEDTLEKLRAAPPSITWTVRCYHYEGRLLRSSRGDSFSHSSSSKKVVTHTAKKDYDFGSWHDNTVISVWERAKAMIPVTPFTKISLSKMLILSDAKAREDYFSQQANFISQESRRDDHAEFSTSINGMFS